MLGPVIGIVAIGRNEGSRLRLCLESLHALDSPTIYVDSNSTDDSVTTSQELGVSVHQLDPCKPCSAARARREGFRQLLDKHPDLEFVFFVDGDCQVNPNWLPVALDFLHANEQVAAVCGRRREQHPEHSVYNRLCDHEWDTPIGEAQAVGGDAVYRVSAYREAGEFDASVPAGEEPELCKRLRDLGWKIWRLETDMTIHNAAISHLSQWWKRQIRTGYAGHDVERRFHLGIFDRIIKSAIFWGCCLPMFAILTAVATGWFSSPSLGIACLFATIIAYALQIVRIAWRTRSDDYNWRSSLEFGFFTMAAKLPIALGMIRQSIETALGRQAQIVEYKSVENARPQA